LTVKTPVRGSAAELKARRSKPSAMRVVAIGGGTGLSTLLRGLREHVSSPHSPPDRSRPAHLISDLSAIVTVTDDGGSSGRLRRHFNMLPPGDLRNCMVALADDEALLSRLFRHRFSAGEGLQGHSFGNLFVAALAEITGDFAQAIKLSSQVLATRGHIYPATTANVTLAARMDDGSLVVGETEITASHRRICELMLIPSSHGDENGDEAGLSAEKILAGSVAEPLPETLQAIALADLITIGPGSLFTSVITNLLVNGMPEALEKARGVRVYVCNLMTQANESLGLTASQHIERIYQHAGRPIFDYALVNTAPVSPSLRERYAREGAAPIEPDCDRIEALGVRCIAGNFAAEGDVLRHDAARVTESLLRLGRSRVG
jgi:2-phospho-L-lactate transferase/gluconeogenesis factor (CofD/UPF0052 family)